jgi:hypothetical protein
MGGTRLNRGLVWKRLVLPLSLVLALASLTFVLLYLDTDPEGRSALKYEAAKASLNLIAAVVIGNIVLMIVRDFEESRRGWIAKRDLLRKDLTDGLSTLYLQAKGIRRRLRAGINEVDGTATIDAQEYGQLLQAINEIQLGLERAKWAASGGVRVNLLPRSVPSDLEKMEKYLGSMVKEYEQVPKSSEASISLTKLPEVQDFIGEVSESRFRSLFIVPYHTVARAVLDQMEKDLPGAKAN